MSDIVVGSYPVSVGNPGRNPLGIGIGLRIVADSGDFYIVALPCFSFNLKSLFVVRVVLPAQIDAGIGDNLRRQVGWCGRGNTDFRTGLRTVV